MPNHLIVLPDGVVINLNNVIKFYLKGYGSTQNLVFYLVDGTYHSLEYACCRPGLEPKVIYDSILSYKP